MAAATLGPEYLRAEDLIRGGKWCENVLTISLVHAPNTVRGPDKKFIDKPILEFEETKLKLVLGRLNKRLLRYETGATLPSELVGKKLTLYPVVGDWFGQKNVTSQRIRVTDGKPGPSIRPANLGTDITGRVIAKMPTTEPQATPTPTQAESPYTDDAKPPGGEFDNSATTQPVAATKPNQVMQEIKDEIGRVEPENLRDLQEFYSGVNSPLRKQTEIDTVVGWCEDRRAAAT